MRAGFEYFSLDKSMEMDLLLNDMNEPFLILTGLNPLIKARYEVMIKSDGKLRKMMFGPRVYGHLCFKLGEYS